MSGTNNGVVLTKLGGETASENGKKKIDLIRSGNGTGLRIVAHVLSVRRSVKDDCNALGAMELKPALDELADSLAERGIAPLDPGELFQQREEHSHEGKTLINRVFGDAGQRGRTPDAATIRERCLHWARELVDDAVKHLQDAQDLEVEERVRVQLEQRIAAELATRSSQQTVAPTQQQTQDKGKAEAALAELRRQAVDADKRLKQLEAEARKLDGDIAARKIQIESKTKEATAAKTSLESLQQQIREADARLKDLQKQIEQSEKEKQELDTWKALVVETETALKKREEAVTALEAEWLGKLDVLNGKIAVLTCVEYGSDAPEEKAAKVKQLLEFPSFRDGMAFDELLQIATDWSGTYDRFVKHLDGIRKQRLDPKLPSVGSKRADNKPWGLTWARISEIFTNKGRGHSMDNTKYFIKVIKDVKGQMYRVGQ